MLTGGKGLVSGEQHFLNPDKSEVLLAGTRAQTQKTDASGLAVTGSDIKFSVKLKSLGVTLDQTCLLMTMSQVL